MELCRCASARLVEGKMSATKARDSNSHCTRTKAGRDAIGGPGTAAWVQSRGASHDASKPPKRYRTGYRAGPRAYSATVVATMHDPQAIRCPPGDNTDVVSPDNHHPNSRSPRIRTFPSPLSRQSKTAVRLPEVTAHVNPAPRVCSMHVMMPGRRDAHPHRP
jgi:hypothetical protein